MKNIPKELHLYWNSAPMSQLQTFTVESFHKLNPDWNINLYRPHQTYNGGDRYIPDYSGEDYFSSVLDKDYINVQEVDLDDYGIEHHHHDILRSDIFRYHKLYEMGGVWSDFDVLWLKPMSHFNNIEYNGDVASEDIKTVVSFIQETKGGHSIGIMIHCKNDPYILDLIEATKKVEGPFTHEVFGGPLLHTIFPTLGSIPYEGVVGARFASYYPYNIHPVQIENTIAIQELYFGNNLSPINNNVMCLHWYNGHQFTKHYLNNDGLSRDCSMTTLLKQEGYI